MDQSNPPARSGVTPDAVPTPPPSDFKAIAEVPPAEPHASAARVNLLWLLLLLGAVFLAYRIGWEDSLRWGMVVLGLGFLIFIHELGHFLAAKWCDVHVQTFSIGFGPALPGCSFRRGETFYKIAAIPLGGYVSMVGEGPEADEEENYPRSYKNKRVWQRMIIISAGVVMNLLFGAVAFIAVYLWLGEDRPLANIGLVDAGSPAWKESVRPGWKIVALNDKPISYFDDVRQETALSKQGAKLDYRLEALPGFPGAPGEAISITPLRDENNTLPVVGISTVTQLKLAPALIKSSHAIPVVYASSAAAARALALEKGDVLLASTQVQADDTAAVTPLPEGAAGWAELGKRLLEAKAQKDFTVNVRRQGKETEIAAGPVAFDFGDTIVATTDPATPDEPYQIKDLPAHSTGSGEADPFDFRRRMTRLAGKPVVIRVFRESKGEKGKLVDLLVPPEYHLTFGMRMKMGKVAAIRAADDTPARKAGLQENDVILGAAVRYDGGPWELLVGEALDPKVTGAALDPMRLPDLLYNHIHADPKRGPNKWEVKFTVIRPAGHNAQARQELPPMNWDDSWEPGSEAPVSRASPLSIPQLGLAYQVDSTVSAVETGSQAAKAGILPGDEIRQIRLRVAGKTPEAVGTWTNPLPMKSVRNKQEVYDQWAAWFTSVQHRDIPLVEFEVYRANSRFGLFEMRAEPDTTWPAAERGLLLTTDTERQIARSLPEAVSMGLDKTWRMTRMIYLSLRSMLSGRVDKSMVGGPLTIASGAFEAASDLSSFLLLLGVISINLAVVNFLPIPVLDGGHMVFLLWEAVVGKPPPESLRVWATYAGLFLILALMVFVFYNDFDRLRLLPWKWKW